MPGSNPVKGYIDVLGTAGAGRSSRIEFMWNPEEISEDFDVGWTSTVIPGLPLTVKHYRGGGEQETTFRLQLVAPYEDPKGGDAAEQVDRYIDDLYSLGLPFPPEGGSFQFFMPPVLRLVIGKIRRTVVLTKIRPVRKYFDNAMNSAVAEVDVTFQTVMVINY